MEKIRGTKKGFKRGDNKLLLLAFIKKTDPKKYNDITKLPFKTDKGGS